MSLSAVSNSIRSVIENYAPFIRKPTVAVASAAFGLYHAISGNRYLAAAGIASTILSIYLQQPDTLTAEKFSGQVNRFIDEVHSSLQDGSFHAKKSCFCGRFREICAFEGASTISDDQRVRLNQVREVLSSPLSAGEIQRATEDLKRLIRRCAGMKTNTLLPPEERAARVKEYNRLNEICWKWGGCYKADLDDIRNRMPPKTPPAGAAAPVTSVRAPSLTEAQKVEIRSQIGGRAREILTRIATAKSAGTFEAERGVLARQYQELNASALQIFPQEDWGWQVTSVFADITRELSSQATPAVYYPLRTTSSGSHSPAPAPATPSVTLTVPRPTTTPSPAPVGPSSLPPRTGMTAAQKAQTRTQLGTQGQAILTQLRAAMASPSLVAQRDVLVNEGLAFIDRANQLSAALDGSLGWAAETSIQDILHLLAPQPSVVPAPRPAVPQRTPLDRFTQSAREFLANYDSTLQGRRLGDLTADQRVDLQARHQILSDDPEMNNGRLDPRIATRLQAIGYEFLNPDDSGPAQPPQRPVIAHPEFAAPAQPTQTTAPRNNNRISKWDLPLAAPAVPQPTTTPVRPITQPAAARLNVRAIPHLADFIDRVRRGTSSAISRNDFAQRYTEIMRSLGYAGWSEQNPTPTFFHRLFAQICERIGLQGVQVREVGKDLSTLSRDNLLAIVSSGAHYTTRIYYEGNLHLIQDYTRLDTGEQIPLRQAEAARTIEDFQGSEEAQQAEEFFAIYGPRTTPPTAPRLAAHPGILLNLGSCGLEACIRILALALPQTI